MPFQNIFIMKIQTCDHQNQIPHPILSFDQFEREVQILDNIEICLSNPCFAAKYVKIDHFLKIVYLRQIKLQKNPRKF